MPLPHAPWQRNLEEVPTISLNVRAGLEEYQRVMRLKKHRERRIGIRTFRNVPMTSREPREGVFSYHIIILEDPNRPGVYVDLLICDQNQYLVAFRRRVDNLSSQWFCFKDQQKNMPSFLASTPLSFKGSHTATTTVPVGANVAFVAIFGVLANPASGAIAVRTALLRAIILLCEATRIFMVLRDMARRMNGKVEQDELVDLMWVRIRKWKKMSNYSLYARNKVLVQGGDGVQEVEPQVEQEEDPKETELLGYLEGCEIYNLDQLVRRQDEQPRGQLRLILLDDSYYRHYGQVLHFPDGYVDNFRAGDV